MTHAPDLPPDLRSFLDAVKTQTPRDYLAIDEPLDARWELAAFTQSLHRRMRMPVIEYRSVRNHGRDCSWSVIHNVCASLNRIARASGWSLTELETRLDHAYDAGIPAEIVSSGPVMDHVYTADAVNLRAMPGLVYTESQTRPYLSAAHVIARDPASGAINISFHRMMIVDRSHLAIFMTRQGHLERIFSANRANNQDTPITAFIGAHPLWSLASLASGAMSLDELSVIGGLQGSALPVLTAQCDSSLLIPAQAEIALEGVISCQEQTLEGPYGEAFGYVSQASRQPVIAVSRLYHRHQPLFQDIIPGQLEHLTMTGVATQVYLRKSLSERFNCVCEVHLVAPMSVYIAVSDSITADTARALLEHTLRENRFIKQAVLFDQDIDIRNSRHTQHALAMHVQAGRDILAIDGLHGNGLDPSEQHGKTSKWGVDATSYTANTGNALIKNRLPQEVFETLDVSAILKRASFRQ